MAIQGTSWRRQVLGLGALGGQGFQAGRADPGASQAEGLETVLVPHCTRGETEDLRGMDPGAPRLLTCGQGGRLAGWDQRHRVRVWKMACLHR